MQAVAKYIRMSPRKVRLVADLVRGLSVPAARQQLTFSKKGAAVPVLKALNSAVANAENTFSQNASDLIVSEIRIDDGPTIKRHRPRARGAAFPIRKRTSHITVVVGQKKDAEAAKEVKVEEKPATEVKKATEPKASAKKAKPAVKSKKSETPSK